MKTRLSAIMLLLFCAGCAQSDPAVTVSGPNAPLFDSVTKAVYPQPQDQSVFGDVYEPPGATHELVPRMPGEPAAEQEKPPLLNTN
ncbi:hypothetical protein [Paenibacillus glycinis]|uniref:Uncharacterized protein n=1 Tax=Paenibacillus glycinis TaxID=2697035 RepID=A0ABW9XJF1_9BACL|nr:hypothetical protein [Paenibacillus glycinis]NBD22744.1 hypothetical protein [Paenibacillus glycinis]